MLSFQLNAQGTKISEAQQDTLEVYFRQGLSLWDAEYKDNGKHLEDFIKRFKALTEKEEMRRITKIHIVAACSPEGLHSFNQRLSKNRAKSIRNVLTGYISLPDSVIVERPIGINWPGLRRMVVADHNVPQRDKVLDILDNTPELHINDRGRKIELRKLRLMYLDNGKPWKYMYDRFFPTLRSFNLQIVVEWEKYKPAPLQCVEPIKPSEIKSELEVKKLAPAPFTPGEPFTPFYMAAKSNMVYDLMLIPNAGLEFYLGKGFSIEANYMHAWWKNDPSNWYWRTYGGDLGVRYWFGRAAKEKPLTGHHIGAYWQVLTYDFELGQMGIIGGQPGGRLIDEPNWTVGLEYGYSLPVAERLNIDFQIGLGYHWGVFYEYVPIDNCYVWQATKKRNYIGPTKIGISLVWLIGKGNVNHMKKGGER